MLVGEETLSRDAFMPSAAALHKEVLMDALYDNGLTGKGLS
jgi:hypothetical protein